MRNPEQLRDNGERNLRRYVGDEIANVAAGHVVEHLARDVLDFRPERTHAARREIAADDHPIFAVVGRIHVEQMAERRRRTVLEPLLVDEYQQARTVEE